jgi:hypothetical protein
MGAGSGIEGKLNEQSSAVGEGKMKKNLQNAAGALVIGIISVFSTAPVNAQLTTTNLTILSPEDLANALVGPGVTIENVTYTGSAISAGLFDGGDGIIGFEGGVVLSSGEISSIIGPNTSDRTSTQLGTPGDPDLDTLSDKTTYDATVLEFDFIPVSDVVTFQYVFASEEYNEFVNTDYNDTFAFLVGSGTGRVNCAVIGDPPVPVSVNNVNNGPDNDGVDASNAVFYVNNDDGVLNTEMDGLTVVLTCEVQVIPMATNHIKMAIADATDDYYDSNVFLELGSFTSPPPTPPEGGNNCPRTQGYWKNHESKWPVRELYLGSFLYDQNYLLYLLKLPVRGDISVALSKQLIAAKLNLANDTPAEPVYEAIMLADLLVGEAELPMGVRPGSALGQEMEFVKTYLDDYNNGRFTPDCKDDDSGSGQGKEKDNGRGKKSNKKGRGRKK